jgi:thioredoxin reductase (NADPH)
MAKQYSFMMSLTVLLILSSFVVGFIFHKYIMNNKNQLLDNNSYECIKSLQQGNNSYLIDFNLLKTYKNICPIVVIGSGPAGCAAALYGGRLGIPTLVFAGDTPGGQLMRTGIVENWSGTGFFEGPYIMDQAKMQAQTFGALFLEESVISIDTSEWPYRVIGSQGTNVYALSIVLATGSTPKILNVPGEREFWGNGVTTCAICDAPLHRGKPVVVVGAGDSACEEACQLVPYASEIHMFVRGDSMRASKVMQDRVKNIEKIIIHFNTQIQSIEGTTDKGVTHVIYSDNDGTKQLKATGVFIAIGHTPNIDLVKDSIELTSHGLIACKNNSQATSIDGVFAAGDIENMYRQAGVASGNGIKAALDAGSFLFKIGFNYSMLLNYNYSFNELTLKELKKAQHKMIKDVVEETSLENKDIELILKENDEKKASRKEVPNEIIDIETDSQFYGFLSDYEIVVVDFYSTWCPPCKKLAVVMKEYAENNRLLFPIIKINVECEKLDKVASKYKIRNLPTILVFKNGVEVLRHVGGLNKVEFSNFINNIKK